MQRRAAPWASALALLAAAALIVAACGGGGGSASGGEEGSEITLLAYSGIFQDNYQRAVVEPFMRENPDVTVNYQPSDTSAQSLAQLRSQGGRAYDVAIMDVSVADTGNDEGVFARLDPELVPNLDNLVAEAETPDGFGPSVTFDNLSMIYNTEMVPQPPTSWNALWNPDFDNQVIVPAPPDIQGLALTIITNEMEGADYKETIDPAIERLQELAPLVQTWEPKPDQYTIVTAGNAAVAVGWNARSQLYADQSDGRMAVALPEEGSVFQENTINLVEGSDSPEAAQRFIDYALSAEAQQAFSEAMFYAPVNEEVELPPKVLERTAASEGYEIIPVDWNYMTEVQDEWLQRWRREVISR